MPRPTKREQKNDFMKRCIPELIHEGREQKQGIAACFGIWGSSNKVGDTSEQEYRRKHKKSYEVDDKSKSYERDVKDKRSYEGKDYENQDHKDGRNHIDGKNSYDTYASYEADRKDKKMLNKDDKIRLYVLHY